MQDNNLNLNQFLTILEENNLKATASTLKQELKGILYNINIYLQPVVLLFIFVFHRFR